MKNKKRNNNNNGIIVATLIITIGVILRFIHVRHVDKIMSSTRTEYISAKIIKVGKITKGGVGSAPTLGYINVEYYVDSIRYFHSIESFYIKNHLDNYLVGNCIKIKVSLEDPNVYEFEEEQNSFKCD